MTKVKNPDQVYTAAQSYQIELGEREGITTSLYDDPKWTAGQMREIRLGEKEGLNTDSYRKLNISEDKMREKRREMMSALQVVDQVVSHECYYEDIQSLKMQAYEDQQELERLTILKSQASKKAALSYSKLLSYIQGTECKR